MVILDIKSENMKKIEVSLLLICIFILYICSVFSSCKCSTDKAIKTSIGLYTKTFKVKEGYGYEIYADTTLLIKQKFIPGQSGTNVFKTEAMALEVANLVIHKLSNQIHPPIITQQELDSL